MSKVDINILGTSIGKVADSITEITKAVVKWLGSANSRRTAKAIRTGDKIVLRIRDLNIDDKRLNRLLILWDKYNN